MFAPFTTTAKEEILSPFPLCCADPPLASCMVNLEKPHQGVAGKNPALHPGITWSNSTTALGLRTLAVENRVRSRCTGKERDAESGLDNFGARYNASSMGRFMTPDPLYIEEQKMLDPQQLNLYSYVRNNPLSLTDPTGMLVDLNCQQVSSEQCAQTVSDFNNRQGNQFQVTRDEQTGQLNVSVQTEITDPGEKALYNAITNKDATGTLTVTPNDSSFDFETSTGKGANSLDRSDLNALGAADKHAPGDVISHAAIESYESAKPGVSVDQAHDIAGTYFGFSHGAFTPNWGTTVTGFGVKWRFYHVNENLLEQAKLKTPIPRATWNNLVLQGGSMTLPRDVTSVGVLP